MGREGREKILLKTGNNVQLSLFTVGSNSTALGVKLDHLNKPTSQYCPQTVPRISPEPRTLLQTFPKSMILFQSTNQESQDIFKRSHLCVSLENGFLFF